MDNQEPYSMDNITPFTVTELMDAIHVFQKAHTYKPAYAILDPLSFIHISEGLQILGAPVAAMGIREHFYAWGLQLIVMPTDGLPLLRIVGEAREEAFHALLER